MITESDEGSGITSIILVCSYHHLGTRIDYYHGDRSACRRARDAIEKLLASGFRFTHRRALHDKETWYFRRGPDLAPRLAPAGHQPPHAL